MSKYSLFALLFIIGLAYVMAAPAVPEEGVEVAPVESDVENIEAASSKKTKRGIYGGGIGYGLHYPYSSYYPYGGFYGGYHGYHQYPYISLGYGYGHGYWW
ncbi:hypothetical protein ABEB36_005701 [Hypothenemus hampei]|uniref:Uncharacterized protein n=1 Tax=Hypothenemus hampei TaxID=57062 RepID=A0ABD1EZ85_HYPHA